jgi:hypothetical protein
LAERWDGRRWAIQTIPFPPKPQPAFFYSYSSTLTGVSYVSVSACTAVGYSTTDPSNNPSPLAERWDGTRWTAQPIPIAQGYQDNYAANQLSGVSCPSVNACTATGLYGAIDSWTAPNNKFTVSQIKTEADGTIRFSVGVPGPGSVDVLETAWDDNLASAAALLEPARNRFVYARAHVDATRPGTQIVSVYPNDRGGLLVAHHKYPVVLRLWVSYTPDRWTRTIGFLGLHLHGTCGQRNAVTALHAYTVVRCK